VIYPGQVLTIPGSDEVHVVAFGETLGRIARKYGSTASSIASANSLSNPNLIRVGQELIIPAVANSGSGGDGGKTAGDAITDRTGQYHVVKRGENLTQIAAQYSGVTVDDLIRANGIVNGFIYAGSALYLSGPGYVASGSAGETTYKVRSGDRLGDIAHSNGVSLSTLTTVNKISNPNLIRIGQNLIVPTGTRWVCPVDNASFKNDWGFPRGGGTRYHEGNDLFTRRGTPVKAPVSGTVRFVTGSIGGLQFSLDAGGGVRYVGTHMDKFGKEGKVKAGDIIGYVGNSGNAARTNPHLHFGMYYKGTPVNPYPTLVAHGCT